MKIRTVKPWFDKKANRVRSKGDIQEVTKERFDEIVKTLQKFKDVTWIEPVVEIPNVDDLTVKEIKQKLDKAKVEYDSSLKKSELYSLLLEI